MTAASKPVAAVAAKSARAKRRPGRGALWIIALLLGSSGLIRLGEGAGQALALSTDPTAAAPEGAMCEAEGGALAMLEDLRAREARLIAREASLADRGQALAVAETQISEKLAALIAAEDQLSSTIAVAEQASERDVAQLTAVYENMKPKLAAPVFAEMAPEFAAGFLSRMRPESAAAIMAGLDPKAAYAISVLLAGRNANVPKN